MRFEAEASRLILIDLQARLMPAIDDGASVLARCLLLGRAARLLGVPVLATEQNPAGLGANLDEVRALADRSFAKISFDATGEPDFVEALAGARRALVVAGCEAHVCVLQTVLGLRERGLPVALVADAVGTRRPADRAAALERAAQAGAEIVSAEMIVFEWLRRSDHPRFREALALVR
jgi:nicotinamidase-related amidase